MARTEPGNPRIEDLRLRNFKVFRKASMSSLPTVCYIVGANGTGKSTLLDVFAFLRDCTVQGVGAALDKRGGYHEVMTREADGGIGIELTFRMDALGARRSVAYALEIGADPTGSPRVERETLRCKTGPNGSHFPLIDFRNGSGEVAVSEEDGLCTHPGRETFDIGPDATALSALGNFPRHKEAFAIRRSMAKWHVSDFHLTAAKLNGAAKYHAHLSADGGNLGKVARDLQVRHPEAFEEIRQQMRACVPGITSVDTEALADGSILLKFGHENHKKPFNAGQVSNGTLQTFAQLILLHDPDPLPLLCVEEPERHMYFTTMMHLDAEFHEYALRGEGQVMVATHSPSLLDVASIEQVHWLTKKRGVSRVRRAKRDVFVAELVRQGELLGQAWISNCFEGASPKA